MKGILEFNLDEPEDRDAHRRATNADRYDVAICDIKNLLRKVRKYDYKIAEGTEVTMPLGIHTITAEESNLLYKVIGDLEDEIYEIINNLGVNED